MSDKTPEELAAEALEKKQKRQEAAKQRREKIARQSPFDRASKIGPDRRD